MIGSPQDMVSQFHSLETAPLRNGLARFLPLAIPEVWLRFLLALLGLLLAFAAAMFSTVARESGNVVATAVLAPLTGCVGARLFRGNHSGPAAARRARRL